MGLDVVVGWLAQSRQELSDEEFQPIFEPFLALNEVLDEAGQPPHHEPLEIADGDVFEAQMWGYNGLHMVRRLAAHWVIEGALPPPVPYADIDQMPLLDQLYAQHNAYFAATEKRGLLSRFVKPRAVPPFAHLLLHSDCEVSICPGDMSRSFSIRACRNGRVSVTWWALHPCCGKSAICWRRSLIFPRG
jgi:hypothetical protein